MNALIQPLDKRAQLLAAAVAITSQALAVLAMGLVTGWNIEPKAPSQTLLMVAYTVVSMGASVHYALLDMNRRRQRS